MSKPRRQPRPTEMVEPTKQTPPRAPDGGSYVVIDGKLMPCDAVKPVIEQPLKEV